MISPTLQGHTWSTGRIVGIVILSIFILLALVGPSAFNLDPARQSLMHTLQPPGDGYILGTDHLGRDMAARLISGGRLTLVLALMSVVTAAVPGVALGILAGWSGGWTDRIISSFADVVLALPGLLLVLVLAAIAPGKWWVLYIGISLTLWVEYFRFVRAQARVLVTAPAVEASRLLGFGRLYILRRHVLPELAAGLLTVASFGAATAVTAVAALGFLGVGLQPPTAEWGLMMTELLPYWREAPWLTVQPVLSLALAVIALYLVAGKISS